MKISNLDAILASVPHDATAARVTSQNGEHWEPEFKLAPGQRHSDTPLLTVPIPERSPIKAGHKFGRFTVMGKYGGPKGNAVNRASYVVRCACGNYETRTAKAILGAPLEDAMCHACKHMEKVRRGLHKKRDWKIGPDGRVVHDEREAQA